MCALCVCLRATHPPPRHTCFIPREVSRIRGLSAVFVLREIFSGMLLPKNQDWQSAFVHVFCSWEKLSTFCFDIWNQQHCWAPCSARPVHLVSLAETLHLVRLSYCAFVMCLASQSDPSTSWAAYIAGCLLVAARELNVPVGHDGLGIYVFSEVGAWLAACVD